MNSGIIYNIQRFCVHDGPGIRTTVFLKGCPLRCSWCCNPESQESGPELMYNAILCHGCGRCVSVCPREALRSGTEGLILDRKKCAVCGKCVEFCPWKALNISGREMSFAELTAEVLKDRQYYEMSGGGVTFSGGEPTVQGDFLTELLTAYRKKGISTALETSGFCPVEKFSAIVRLCDIVLFDVKQTDGETHKLFTGAENRVILENLCNTASVTRTIVRVPLIPGFNNNKDFYTSLAQLLKDTAVSEVHLLPYHRLGSGKYRQLDRRETCTGIQKLTDKEKNNALDTITRLLDIPVFLY